MSKNVKRVISALLAAGMLLGSFATVAFADDAAATTEAAPIAEVTAAATTTAATDDYYEEAIGLLTKMGIFQGYEDGSIQPESTITRAEMAAVILRTLDMDATSTYAGKFTDVDASHWAASVIQTAANAGIINGMGDGTFAPDAPVTYEQAVKMIICAIGYEGLATQAGGYPTGYISVAGRKNIDVTKNASGAIGENATRGTVAKLIYNALSALYPTASGSTAEGVEYSTSADITVASKIHNIHVYEGIVTATATTSIDPSIALIDSQVAIDDKVFASSDVDMAKNVGYKVKAYYFEKNNDGDRNIVYVVPNKKNDTLTIAATCIEEGAIKNIRTADAVIEYKQSENSSKTKKAKLSSPTIIYNGKKLYASDITTGETMEDFINPEIGKLTLNDYDGDGEYDVVFVEKYETFVAASATKDKVTGKYDQYIVENGVPVGFAEKAIVLDTEDDNNIITIVKDGKEITPKNVKKWDVLSVLRSVNATGDKVITVKISNDTVEGKITDIEIDSDTGSPVGQIDGKTYKIDKNLYISELMDKAKAEGIFYLDSFGRIAGMDSSSDSKLSGKEQYGWLIRVHESSELDAVIAKLFTQGGEVKSFEMNSKVDFWGPEADAENETLDFANDYEDALDRLMDADAYANATAVAGLQMKLVKYELNADEQIKKLIMPLVTQSYSSADEERVVVYNANLSSAPGLGNMLDKKFSLEDGMIEFTVPSNIKDISDTETYKVGKADAATFINYDGGVGFDYVMAEFDNSTPSVVIRFIGSSSAAADFTYNTANDSGLFMISKIQKVYDDAEEEEVYKITGYANGNKVEYTTTKTTSVAEAVGISGGVYVDGAIGYTGDTNRFYGVTPIWTAAREIPVWTREVNGTLVSSPIISEANQAKYDDLRDCLKVGDIVGVETSGVRVNTIVKMLSTKDYIENGSGNPWGKMAQYSSTRDGLAFGEIEEIEVSDFATFATSNNEVYAYDPGYYVITYDVKTGDVLDDVTAADLQPYEDGEGDMVFLRVFKNGQREVFAIRFE